MLQWCRTQKLVVFGGKTARTIKTMVHNRVNLNAIPTLHAEVRKQNMLH